MDRLKRLYEILETPFGASLEEIQQKYRDLAVVWHPDRFAHNPRLQATALEKLKDINGAYNELTAYLKQYGPPSATSLNRERKEDSEKVERERAREQRETEARARTTLKKSVTPMGPKPLTRVLVGTALLIACLAAGYLLIPKKKGIPVADTPPAGIVAPAPGARSSPAVKPPPETVPQAPSSTGPTPYPAQVLSPSSPAQKPGLRRTEKAPQRETMQEPSIPVRAAPVPDSAGAGVLQQALDRCRTHSPADWCGRVVERCREYLRECRKLSQSDSSYRESAECRGVREWCYNDPSSVIQFGTGEEEQGYEWIE